MQTSSNVRRTIEVIFIVGSILSPGPSYAYTAYIDHPSGYASGSCHNADNDGCGDVTYGMRSALGSAGWSVNYWSGTNAWATDFIDCTITSGDDCNQADAAQLAVYDGHGNTGFIGFATSHAGLCNAYSNQTELGRLGGATSALFISTACCYMHLGKSSNFTDHGGLNQQLGFGGESSMDNDMMNNFYNSSSGVNYGAWIVEMEDRPGWFTGDNTTVAFTRGSSTSDVNTNKYSCGLKRGTCLSRKGYSVGSAWVYDYYDHGSDGCAPV